MKILISGAGIGGPALALALEPFGHEVVVVERATELRTGGQAVDFRGDVHRRVLEDLELWAPILARQTTPKPIAFIDAAGKTKVTIPAVLTAGDVEIVRGDLCDILHARTRAYTEYRFGEAIAELNGSDRFVEATFRSGRRESFDLVVGADGLHSAVRGLAFGPEEDLVRSHGYCLATYSFRDDASPSPTSVTYSEPGRSVSVSSPAPGERRASFMFASAPPDRRWTAAATRAWVRERFAGARWETERLLTHLDEAEDLYVDSIATVHVDCYSRGRVVLLGDAAWGGTIGGQGTGLAVVGAWVLAHEIAAAGPDVDAALTAYETRMRPYAKGCQQNAINAGPFLAPRTRLGLLARNAFYRVMTSSLLSKQFERMVKASATAFELPSYET